MKLVHSLTLLVVASLAMPSALANFHLIQGIDPHTNVGNVLVACPSNQYNCDCFTGADHGAEILDHSGIPGSPGDFFWTDRGLCGMPRLDFYKREDGHWDFFTHNGDGTVEGRCYTNAGHQPIICEGNSYIETLLCSSYICNK
ncbi:hypothetical protein BS47DRAFT_1340251 [Hydnum rufescens UP504]|uniref:Uncharacterized protein n=1 Tax=Hydnum rufescens UP504 TaxID=1448309 RepID=A0A9P6B3Y0_9AGAM|nr:hypothetical protein BS47DRAFT_1340251 [Hydnum rufescens UP504]